jgi:hypothetical protein
MYDFHFIVNNVFSQVLFSDTCFTAQALVRLFVDLNEKSLEVVWNANMRVDEDPRFDDVLATFTLLADKLGDCRQLLQVSKTKECHAASQNKFRIHSFQLCIFHFVQLMNCLNVVNGLTMV